VHDDSSGRVLHSASVSLATPSVIRLNRCAHPAPQPGAIDQGGADAQG